MSDDPGIDAPKDQLPTLRDFVEAMSDEDQTWRQQAIRRQQLEIESREALLEEAKSKLFPNRIDERREWIAVNLILAHIKTGADEYSIRDAFDSADAIIAESLKRANKGDER